MHLLLAPLYALLALAGMFPTTNTQDIKPDEKPAVLPLVDCNCSITQGGLTYPISALLGNESATAFYSYGTPLISSANTGLELSNGLILFLYQDLNTNLVSLFLIADVGNSGSGGSMQFETNCLPSTAFVSVQDDPGEFSGGPPSITGNWSWTSCCTDGGVIEDIGCSNTINLDLLVASGLDSIVWLTGDMTNPTHILLSMSGEAITINCGGGICCPIGFDTDISITDTTSQLTTFTIGNLGQSDTVTLFVTALYNQICTVPLTNSVTCVTEVCDPVFIEFPGLEEEYCKDEPFVVITTNPTGGILSGDGISGDTLFPSSVNGLSTSIEYTWIEPVSGCEYSFSSPVQFVQPPTTPIPECQPSTLNSVYYTWGGTGFSFGFTFSINQGPLQGPYQTPGRFLKIDTLQEGDAVTINLWSVGQPPCGNSDTVSITCVAKECPQAGISIVRPDLVCSADEPFPLGVNVIGLPDIPLVQWSGQGIADPTGIFDPSLAMIGDNTVQVTVSEGGCSYDTTLVITVVPTPIAFFDVVGTPCIDSTLQVVFSGDATSSADFQWELDGAEIVSGALPYDFDIRWNTPGAHAVTLQIDDQACLSDLFELPFFIDALLEPPVISCVEESYYSLSVDWEPVNGASQYSVSSSIGTGSLSGTTYTVSNLPDNTPVTIQVVATGISSCGPSSAMIECQTEEYIPPQIFIPNIFSPNGDGINDQVFIQSNDRIILVNALRIFDRWGNIVFEDFNFLPNDAHHGWDGIFNGKLMNPAVFTYLAEVKTIDHDLMLVTGDVSLVR